MYGAAQAGLDSIEAAQPSRWFEQLNLSPVNRAVARLGTMVVQQRQDELMASAWDQAAELRRVNQLLRQNQLGERVATSLHTRHIEQMDPEVGLQVLAPARARMVRTSTALAEQFAGTGLSPTVFSTALRRVARPRGGLNRRLRRVSTTPVKLTTRLLVQLQPLQVMSRILPGAGDTGPVTLERVAQGFGFDVTWGEATESEIKGMPKRRFFAFVPMGEPVPMGPGPGEPPDPLPPFPTFPLEPLPGVLQPLDQPLQPGEPGPPEPPEPPVDPNPDPIHPTHPHPHPHPPTGFDLDSAAAQLFRKVAAEHMARFNPPRAIKSVQMLDGALEAVFNEVKERTRPSETFALRARASFTIPGPDRDNEAALDPVGLSPYFPQPMVEPLTEIAQRLVVPGLELVPPNTVVPLETNTTFVQSYLVGLNTEMGRELLWRDFPADLGATYFDRFWDASSSPGRAPDIDDLASWGSRPLGVSAADEDFVLLVRSELLRRYPDAIIYAVKGAEERAPDLQRRLRARRSVLRLRHRRSRHRRLEHRHPGAPVGAALRHRGRHRHRHGHPRRPGRWRRRPDRRGSAAAPGAHHDPGHRPDEERVMAVKVPDLGAILAASGGPPGLDADAGASTHPLALFPVRLETRFFGTELRIRVYPDKVHLDSHDPALSANEQLWGRRYWELHWEAGSDDSKLREAWRMLAGRLGPERAAWVVRALTPTNPSDRRAGAPAFPDLGDPTAVARTPLVRLLPDRWVATAYAGGAAVAVAAGNDIEPDLAIGPDLEADVTIDDEVPAVDEGMRWMVDFERAEDVGMALRMTLPTTEVDVLLVVGTSDGDRSADVAAQLDAHHFTDGLAFLPPGSPTNNTEAGRTPYQSPDPQFDRSFAEELLAGEPDSREQRRSRPGGSRGRPVSSTPPERPTRTSPPPGR